jgi:hypothetical protein
VATSLWAPGRFFDVTTAQQCLDAGTAFLSIPGLDLEIVNFAVQRGTIVIPGALTPSEVTAVWKAKPESDWAPNRKVSRKSQQKSPIWMPWRFL